MALTLVLSRHLIGANAHTAKQPGISAIKSARTARVPVISSWDSGIKQRCKPATLKRFGATNWPSPSQSPSGTQRTMALQRGLVVAFRKMPYEFTEREPEPRPQASSSRAGGPPRKTTAVGILDPPVPPKRQNPLLPIAGSLFIRVFAAIILIAMVVLTVLLLLPQR